MGNLGNNTRYPNYPYNRNTSRRPSQSPSNLLGFRLLNSSRNSPRLVSATPESPAWRRLPASPRPRLSVCRLLQNQAMSPLRATLPRLISQRARAADAASPRRPTVARRDAALTPSATRPSPTAAPVRPPHAAVRQLVGEESGAQGLKIEGRLQACNIM